jgi:hypothetical protein
MAYFHKCFAQETCCGIGVQETGDLSPKDTSRNIWNMRLTQYIIQRALSVFYLGVKRPGREADNLPQSTADVKVTEPHLSTRPYVFTAQCLITPRQLSFFIKLIQKWKCPSVIYNVLEQILLVGRSRDRFPVVSLDFSVIYSLPTVPWPWGRLSP